jgi:hypothetical protein
MLYSHLPIEFSLTLSSGTLFFQDDDPRSLYRSSLSNIALLGLQDDDAAFSRADPEAAWPRAAYVRLAALTSACVRSHRAKRPWMGEILDQLNELESGGLPFDALSNTRGGAGWAAASVEASYGNEDRRAHLNTVDANGRRGGSNAQSTGRPSLDTRAFDAKEQAGRSSGYNSASSSGSENGERDSKNVPVRPPYSANYVARPEKDFVDPSALWAPEPPVAPRKCAHRKGEQIADERAGVSEQREAPGVSWWPRNGGHTLTLEDAPRKEGVHAGMPAAGGPR